jgi:hypothetical protein
VGDVTVHQLSLGRRAARRSRRPASVPCHGSRRWQGRAALPRGCGASEPEVFMHHLLHSLSVCGQASDKKAPLFCLLTREPPCSGASWSFSDCVLNIMHGPGSQKCHKYKSVPNFNPGETVQTRRQVASSAHLLKPSGISVYRFHVAYTSFRPVSDHPTAPREARRHSRSVPTARYAPYRVRIRARGPARPCPPEPDSVPFPLSAWRWQALP